MQNIREKKSEREKEKSTKNCPHCQQKLPLSAKFCARCGNKLEVSKPTLPISDLIEKKETLEPISTVSESKIDEIETRQPISVEKEVNGQINLDWLKYQYYDLGRSMQDIADELGHSMMRIRKLLYRSGIVPEIKEVESMTEVSPIKSEELQPIPPISELIEGEDTSKPIPSVSELKEEVFNTCPHCNAKFPLGAKFCAVCGEKIEVLRPITPIAELEEELTGEIVVEEAQQIQSVYIRKEKKPKREFPVCKFCGMRIPKNKDFCLQCGMIIKSY
ncbi:MAG: zinc ribbon domain-containing protein [Promethearchaeota archaeon]